MLDVKIVKRLSKLKHQDKAFCYKNVSEYHLALSSYFISARQRIDQSKHVVGGSALEEQNLPEPSLWKGGGGQNPI